MCVAQYEFRVRELSKYSKDEPTPAEVDRLLSQIESHASGLNSSLCRLQMFANRLDDPTARDRRGHLRWLDAYISQAVAGVPSNEVNEGVQHLLIDAKMQFLARLAMIEAAAKTAPKRLDKTLLERERGQSTPALSGFVSDASKIWEFLTGRRASANKVHRKRGTNDPDFVLFVQQLAKIACAPEPTRSQVETCLHKPAR
jgi:hypothetical protein